MRQTYHSPDGIQVVTSTVEEELSYTSDKSLRKKAFLAFLQAGGCFSFAMTEEQAAVASAVVPGVEAGWYVVLIEDFLLNHTEDERKALLFHELGHVRHGHVDAIKGSEGLVLVPEYELEADRYASRHVSAAAMRSAIIKTLERTAEVAEGFAVANSIPFDREDYLGKVFADPIVVQRLQVLSSDNSVR